MTGLSVRAQKLLLALALACLTVLVFAPVRNHGFLNYDDDVYVSENEQVSRGLTGPGIAWAISTAHEGNWHPLTLISHMLDVEAFGLDAGRHHRTSLALHVANVLLLFLLLDRTTARTGRSAFAAALFAIHPLNVQSVAWLAERKNLLSTLFWLLALLAYLGYRRAPGWWRYLGVFALFVLGLASKPMVVTLPLTLLLLDDAVERGFVAPRPAMSRAPVRLLLEKVPMLLVAGVAGLVTVWAQRTVGALHTFESIPLSVRLGNAAAGYAWYAEKMFWPARLSVFYPHPMGQVGAGRVAVGVLFLASVSALAWWKRREAPYLLFGWLWYVLTLLPVIGVVQVGGQAYADRYAYVPLIGLFVAGVWGVDDVAGRLSKTAARAAAALGLCAVAALGADARRELAPWRDSVSLFEQAIRVDPQNFIAHDNLGAALVREGRVGEAVEHFRAAVEAGPQYEAGHLNLGNALAMQGRLAEARAQYEDAARLRPDDARVPYNLGRALLQAGHAEDAVRSLREALRLDPAHVRAKTALGMALSRLGRFAEAIDVLRSAVPDGGLEAHYALGLALSATGRNGEAAIHLRMARDLASGDPRLVADIEARIRDLAP